MGRWLAGAGVVVMTVAVALLLRSGERVAPDPPPPAAAPSPIAATPLPTTTSTTTTTITTTTTTTTTTTVPPVERVAVEVTAEVIGKPVGDVLPEFDGTLVATVGLWGVVDLVRWGPDGGAREPLPEAFGPLAFDASGEWMAYLGDTGAGTMVHAGPVGGAVTFSTPAGSAAWHATQPGRLAWLAADGDGEATALFTADLAASGLPQRVAGADPALLHAWGEPGFVVTDWDDAGQTAELQLLTADGSVAAAHPGIDFVDEARDGRLLLVRHVDARTAFLVGRPDLSDLSHIEWAPSDARAEYRMAAWSPDGRHIAFLTYSGEAFTSWELAIWSIFGTADHHVPLGFRAWNVAWSRDGRFVAAPGSDLEGKGKLAVYDRDLDRLYVLELGGTVQHVELVG